MRYPAEIDDGCRNPNYCRTNGLRDDAAKFLTETKPTFLRFPGGNNLYVARSALCTKGIG